MRTYSFYVGSTDTHDAHRNVAGIADTLAHVGVVRAPALTHGVWDGVTENVAIYTVELATDVQAQRIAFALAVLTGNVAVLVVRDTDRDDYSRTFGSTAAYRVDMHTERTGNRTLITDYDGQAGYRYTPSVGGSFVAYLVGLDNTVTPVA